MSETVVPKRRVRRSTAEEAPAVPKRRVSWSVTILSLMLAAALGTAGYFYYQLKWAAKVESGKEIEDLTTSIGQFIELPEGETPTLATVTDREKLADQTFFLKAENGDKVLIYSNSGKAILYRPSTKKVIDMTTVNVAKTEAPTAAPETTPAAPAEEVQKASTVSLLNGSAKVGVTADIEKKIESGFPELRIEQKEAAQKKDYQGVIVVDVTGKYQADAEKLASLLGGKVGTLPEGEKEVATDLLVIIGNQTTEE